eukprot:TRINITY_DN13894_c0_g1_i1.p1 TRINITY_DN13894_c0_g1~~TRINITY_DN13894_c0_g1_i1.p1  ORF type:complete len:286 (-),score=35.65 TRINITY_DN13894_c0_g1_i1:368-1225(-)
MEKDRKTIWLLKSERVGACGEADPYRTAFEEAGWNCTFVPVLSFNFINQEGLKEAIKDMNAYSGLILTSQRAAVALADTLAKQKLSLPAITPIFAVGEATAAAARKALDGAPNEIVIGGDYAAKLADEIVRRHLNTAFEGPLLFLSGNIRRDDLPTALRQAKIPFTELCVYETKTQTSGDDRKIHGESKEDGFNGVPVSSSPEWVAFFSPSGVESFLQMYPYSDQESCIWRRIKLAAIGKTTAADMISRGAWLKPHVVAAAPSAPSLLEAISSYCGVLGGSGDPT